MFRFSAVAVLVLGLSAALAQPAAPLRFKWQPGQSQTFKVTQVTAVTETTLDEKTEKPVTTESRTNMALVRRWTVKDVDAAGVATLEMAIASLKTEIRQADGEVVARDSANPDHAKEMAAFLNKPVVVVRMDGLGRLVEVKESKSGSPARLHAELPFRLTLPESGPAAGQAWDRPFTLKLDPPLGTGESHEFVQKYTCKAVKDGLAVVGVETSLKAPPKTAGEQVPLVPMLWTGEVYFNVAAGKYHAARLKTKTELANHQGEGTKFVYESQYTEDAIEK